MSNYILDPQTILLRLALAIFLGFVIGIDRDESWKQPETVSRQTRFTFLRPGKFAVGLGGVRTYTMLSILGFLLGTIYALDTRTLPVVAIGFVGIVAYISIAYFLNYFDRHTLGLTSEIGLLILLSLSFALGSGILDARIIIAIAIFVSLLFSLKFEFQKLIGSFTKKEIVESIEFVAIAAVFLPWLPNTTFTLGQVGTPLGINFGTLSSVAFINPFQLWLVVVFISSLNFIGYFLAKILRTSSSVLLTAFLGGLVSSTSVTHMMAERSNTAKSQSTIKLLSAATLIANSTSFIRIPIIAFVVNPSLCFEIAPALIFMTIVTLITAYVWQKREGGQNIFEKNPTVFTSPLALKSALSFALLFFLVSLVTSIAQILVGHTGFIATVLLASASGLDAVTIVVGQAAKSSISLAFGSVILFAAVLTNLLFKMGVVAMYGDKRFKLMTILALLGVSLLGALLLVVFIV